MEKIIVIKNLSCLFLLFLIGCSVVKPKPKRENNFHKPSSRSRTTDRPFPDFEKELDRVTKQQEVFDSISQKSNTIENELLFLNETTNLGEGNSSEEIVNLNIEKSSFDRILNQVEKMRIRPEKIIRIINNLKSKKNPPTKEEFKILQMKLKDIAYQNNTIENKTTSVSKMLAAISQSVGILVVQECGSGRIISNVAIPFNHSFGTNECSIVSSDTIWIVKFKKEIEKTISDFLFHCSDIQITLTITIEGFADSQRFSSNSQERNLAISRCRAEAVRDALNYSRNDSIVNTQYKVIGLGETFPYPQLRYHPDGSNDRNRRICKIKAELRTQ